MKATSENGYFSPGSVVWDLESTEKYGAIRETIQKTEIFHAIPGLEVDRFCDTVIAREREQSTGFGRGIAIAHGRTSHIDTSAIALGVSREGIPFNAFDGRPVHLLFIVASHPDRQIDYLRILSSLAKIARNEMIRRELLSCICQEELQSKIYTAFTGALSGGAAARAV